ncbi:MAG: electron transfer flavoprotein subunit beta/FixA family protein [Sedimentisphaeraceae bacterium JB056]
MKIVVSIKQVPETKNVKMDEATGTVIREGVESIVNPLDLYSIELAIRLRETYGGSITAVTMGPPKAREALREAVSMGCDDALLLSDKAFGGSDTWATSYVLSEAVKRLNADIIICGERATDGDTGQVGPGIAAFMDLPAATYVSKVREITDGSCVIERMVEDGYDIWQMSLPAVLTVVKEVSDPRLPTLRGKQKAKKIDIEVWDHQKLGINASKIGLKGSPTRVVKISKPKIVRQCDMNFASDEVLVKSSVGKFFDYLESMELLK